MKKSSSRNVVLLFGSVRIALCLLWCLICAHAVFATLRLRGRPGRVGRESALWDCFDKFATMLKMRASKQSHNALDNHLDRVSRATSKWRIPWVRERIIEEGGRRPVSPLGLTWISPKSYLDQLYAWINRKSVPEERRKLSFSVVRREFNSRHYNIVHFFALRQLTRGLDHISNIRLQSADVRGIRLPFNENLKK